jgi:pSer/pThr/pTyr-binding forkhead associated (FHA) protein
MPSNRTAMLFCPPLPPIRLGTRTPIFIGRHPSCELAIRQDDVSRRHAEVRYERDRFVLYDLQSTNGTFLNGVPIDSAQPLAAGDRVEVGGSIITFCEIEGSAGADWGDADEASTIVCERPGGAASHFGGQLAQVPASALFQLLEMGSNSGLLEIRSDDGVATVTFEMGRPVDASTEKHRGFDAAITIVAIEAGEFTFGPIDTAAERTIEASVTELLLEACRIEDEACRL